MLNNKSIFKKLIFFGGEIKRKTKRKEKRKKLKHAKVSDSSESESSHNEMVSSLVPEIDSITCDGTFKFFKVGKASPSLEFTTIRNVMAY